MSFILDDIKKSNTNVRNNKTTPEIAPVETETNTPTSASSVQIFNNPEFRDVRVVMQDGEPWFVGKDVADKLGYAQTSNMMKRIDTEDFMSSILDGMNMKSILINESGLYSAIIGSKLPSAKKFKRWVTSEVLPAIRKTGGYVDQSRNRIKIIRDYEEKFINRTIELFYDKRVIILKSRLLTLFFLYYITVVKLHVKSRRLSACFCIFLVNL